MSGAAPSPDGDGRRRPTLAFRIVVATVSVALLAALATAGVAYQLVRQVALQQSRDTLRSTTLLVADAPARDRAELVRNLDQARARGIRIVLLHADGTTTPAGGAGVPRSAVDQVQASGSLSARVRQNGKQVLVEGTRLTTGDTVIATQDFSLVQSSTTRLLGRFAIALAFGVAVAIGVGVVVARFVARPLRRAASSARLLASGRRGLAASAGSAQDAAPAVAEIRDMENALAALDLALATSEGRQHEFLLSISHEIRTPLTAIRGYADALADGLVDAAALPTIGRTLVAETTRLEAFTRDLLELARLEADDFRIRPETIDPVELAREATAAWRARAAALDVTLLLVAPAPVASITTDPMRVRQLLDGLLENALRASPPGSTVTIHTDAAERPEWARIVVEDEGPGLTEADTAEVFDRNVLADRYRSTRTVGTGLGLSIASRLVRRLGGTLRAGLRPGGAVDARGPSTTGAAFTVELPAVPPQGLEP
ncbi:sensor histidine kinase [Frondihabitans sp. 762G35]|uniref:sensor histidine kinase n=1 Tax=Frondihabitans sp. 762G35 TaxID=1446794 RepID=UPI000E7066AB|nr:HAMP domain-containing sensor histidine kinase [Frondihabitans sp. 762G35]